MGEVPYILWLIPGIMPWFFISDALTIGGSAIRSNSHFVTKMVYPVATLPVSEVALAVLRSPDDDVPRQPRCSWSPVSG